MDGAAPAPTPQAVKAIPEQFAVYHAKFNNELSKIPALVQIEKTTRIPKTYLVAAVGSVLAILIFLNIWGDLLTDLLGFLYPAYASFKAIESRGTEDDVQWCVFGFLNIAEFFSDILLYWLPLYYTMKALLVLWLALPQFKGSVIVYKSILRPYLVAEQAKIDNVSDKIKQKVDETVSEVQKEFKQE
ncbi:ER membrane protein DP1/Yop1 [Polyrhizophydium stewartii]|uniref:Protein YOP1 n=1 Tax=Polyrhizophydium stewartii TaxID=2732419 RepID=A0ABR4N547_9FUNG